MLESAIKSGEKNKLVPGWLRALIIIPCFAGAILFMIFYMGGTFNYIADIQISWFDGYYVVITSLLTPVGLFTCTVDCINSSDDSDSHCTTHI